MPGAAGLLFQMTLQVISFNPNRKNHRDGEFRRGEQQLVQPPFEVASWAYLFHKWGDIQVSAFLEAELGLKESWIESKRSDSSPASHRKHCPTLHLGKQRPRNFQSINRTGNVADGSLS